MIRSFLTAALLSCTFACPAWGQDVLLAGHVIRLTVEPEGTQNCPRACPDGLSSKANGVTRVCVPMAWACETLEVKVDRVYRGEAGETRTFKTRSGEFGQRFQATSGTVIVSEEAHAVYWAPVLEEAGRQVVDPKKLWRFGGLSASAPGDDLLVPLDEVLARLGVGR